MASIVKRLVVLDFQLPLLSLFHRAGPWPIARWQAWRTGLGGGMRAPVRERWLERERLPDVGRKGLSHRIDLLLQLWHVPGFHDLFHDPHMAGEELAGIGI
jgi:hypothetical protein